jgi:hypothetical protein
MATIRAKSIQLKEAELNSRARVSARKMSSLAIDVDKSVNDLAGQVKSLMSSALVSCRTAIMR